MTNGPVRNRSRPAYFGAIHPLAIGGQSKFNETIRNGNAGALTEREARRVFFRRVCLSKACGRGRRVPSK